MTINPTRDEDCGNERANPWLWKDDPARVLAAVVAVHWRYFDDEGEPGVDDTTPEPEDVWRYDRDFRAALAASTGAES